MQGRMWPTSVVGSTGLEGLVSEARQHSITRGGQVRKPVGYILQSAVSEVAASDRGARRVPSLCPEETSKS